MKNKLSFLPPLLFSLSISYGVPISMVFLWTQSFCNFLKMRPIGEKFTERLTLENYSSFLLKLPLPWFNLEISCYKTACRSLKKFIFFQMVRL